MKTKSKDSEIKELKKAIEKLTEQLQAQPIQPVIVPIYPVQPYPWNIPLVTWTVCNNQLVKEAL